MDQLQGEIERLTFSNPENGFTVAKLKVNDHSNLITLVGTLPSIKVGECVKVTGTWVVDKMHGKQFQVESAEYTHPQEVQAIEKYLSSGLIKGLGPKYAKNIVKRFQGQTLDVIDQNPHALLEVEGIGKKRLDQIIESWQQQKSIREVMIFLQQYGVSVLLAQKIYKHYRNKTLEILKENPFILATHIRGIGFKTADALATKMQIDKSSPMRVQAGILYALNELAAEGHMCYPKKELLDYTAEILDLESAQIVLGLPQLEANEDIVIMPLPFSGQLQDYVWLKKAYICERGLAKEFERLKTTKSHIRFFDQEKALNWAQGVLAIDLADKQIKALAKAIEEKVAIITGGPGTGKSTITQVLLKIYKSLNCRIIIGAPTGKAAKRLSEITGFHAKTLHSLLEYDFRKGGFKRNQDKPLEADLVIIDEASMIDAFLMYQFVRALDSHTKLVLIGDIHQLPSVGPGNVLKDLINSEKIPFTLLNEIFRQAKTSEIILSAHRINQGKFPSLYAHKDSDFFFIEAKEKEAVLSTILSLCSHRLPKRYQFDPLEDIQVLAPMKKGLVGTENLNLQLQKVLNPQGTRSRGIGVFHEGDKVMQIRNNYQKEVFNGDVGQVLSIDFTDESLLVRFSHIDVPYSFQELDELTLAYAISVHKFQGSECPCVIVPVHNCHFMMLQRNLLYTAITRGKRLVVIVGMKQAIAMAVKNDKVQNRFTSLCFALQTVTPEGLKIDYASRRLGFY